jgi:aminoglycoside phosphotransferase (APT) family kinase protein
MTFSDNEIQSRLLEFYENAEPSKQNYKIQNFTKITSGWENEVYSFDVDYNEKGNPSHEELILRIYPGDHAEGKSSREFNGMKELFKAGFPVPQVYILEHDKSIFGKPFVIMERISGQILGKVIDDSPETRKMELARKFCRIFVDLHNLDWHKFNFTSLSYDDHDPYGFINHILSVSSYVDSFPEIKILQPVLDWLIARKMTVPCNRLSIIHWDYHAHNVILKDDDTAIVIDWTNIDIGDFRSDLAWTMLLTSSYGNPEARDIVLNEYEKIAGFKIEQIEYYEVFAIVRRLFSILVSLISGSDKLGMRPEAVDMIRRSDKHIIVLCDLLHTKTEIDVSEMKKLLSSFFM